MSHAEWEARVAEVWLRADELENAELREAIAALAAEQPNDGSGLFEIAGSWDSTGHSDKAIPIYEEALAKGLDEGRRRKAVIQLASSMRNIGKYEAALGLLETEPIDSEDGLDDAVVAFRALVLSDLNREREALADTLTALAKHLPSYQRSVTNYASLLLETEPGERLE